MRGMSSAQITLLTMVCGGTALNQGMPSVVNPMAADGTTKSYDPGMSMFHCHIVEREDIGMMGLWHIMDGGMGGGMGGM